MNISLPEAYWPYLAISGNQAFVHGFFTVKDDNNTALVKAMSWSPNLEPSRLCWGCDEGTGYEPLGLCDDCKRRLT